MLTRLFTAGSFKEPRTWSVGMCCIAIVMLLLTVSQSGSLATDASQIEEPVQESADPNSITSDQLHLVVTDLVEEHSTVLASKLALQCCRTEFPFEAKNDVEVKNRSRHMFQQYVRRAKQAESKNNKALSESLLIKAQAVLFGID